MCGTGYAHLYLDHEPHRRAPGVTRSMMQVDSADPFAAGEWLDPSDPTA